MFKKKKFYIISSVVAVLLLAFLFTREKGSDFAYTTSLIERGDIVQTVSETGEVKSSSEYDLNFLNQGKVGQLSVEIGDKVEEGTVLASLDSDELLLRAKETEAALEVAQQNLNKLVAGATQEEKTISRVSVAQAKASYEAAKNDLKSITRLSVENIKQTEKTLFDLEDSTDNSITTYEQAIDSASISLSNSKLILRKSVEDSMELAIINIDDKIGSLETPLDAVESIIEDDDIKNNLSVLKREYLTETEFGYNKAVEALETAKNSLSLAKVYNNSEKTLLALNDAIGALKLSHGVAQSCFLALVNSVTSSSFTEATLSILKTNMSTYKASISTSLSSLQSSEQGFDNAVLSYETGVSSAESTLLQSEVAYDSALTSAKNTLADLRLTIDQQISTAKSRVSTSEQAYKLTQAQLDKVLAGVNKYDISLANAQVRQARAALDKVSEQLNNSIIVAPISGTITKINYEVGEQVGGAMSVLSMLGDANYEIEILISESDIVKINLNDLVDVTLDAFGDDVIFYGKVSFIEPAETKIQDVIYYKVNVSFDPGAYGIRSGMTADATITTDKREKVLISPNRAVISKGGEDKYVRVLSGGDVLEKVIKTGLKGDDGLVEVMSGLSEGEEVITHIEEK